MKCKNCGHKNPLTAKFCSECGNYLTPPLLSFIRHWGQLITIIALVISFISIFLMIIFWFLPVINSNIPESLRKITYEMFM